MLEVKSVREVMDIIREHFSGYPLGEELIAIEEAARRIVAVDLKATDDIPGFNRSSVDGYAVMASDTFGASDTLPAQLQLIGEVKMGERPTFSLKNGQAAYVPTGGELPQSADAMVMIEYTDNFHDGFIYINKSSAPGNHVVFKGDDIRAGTAVIKAGSRLRPQDVGMAAGMGFAKIPVKRKIRVGIISTGDEIVEINRQPVGSQVRDINAYAIYSGLTEWGAEPSLYGIVPDDFEQIKRIAEKALAESDIVLISGGSSAGTRDETAKVIDALGSPGVLVHGIAVKPGKPTILGRVAGKAVIGLPGHPASAYSIFRIFVCHLLDVMARGRDGFEDERKFGLRAEMGCNYPSNNGREEFLPVTLENANGKLIAQPVFGKSGLISMLTAAHGYIHISRGSEGIDKGREVEVVLY